MQPDDPVCFCFKVSLHKVAGYLAREQPRVPSQLSECLGAGTGCGWCVPDLEQLHDRWQRGEAITLPGSESERALARSRWQKERRAEREAGSSQGSN